MTALIEASGRRWTGGESVVYQKSMLVAFLYDLKLRTQSNGKRSLDDVYRELFRRNHTGTSTHDVESRQRASGNEAVMGVLSSMAGMQDFADSFIRRPAPVNLQAELSLFGLNVERVGLRSQISVSERLSRRQRDLLHELGYNDYVRAGTKRK